MKSLERNLNNQHLDLLLQQLFTGSHVPENLVGMVRSFQQECIAQGIEDKLHFKESVVKRCEIQIGTIHLDLTMLDEEKVKKSLEASAQAEKEIEQGKEQATGHIDWQFTGVNQFGAVTIRIKERSWQIEFSRLQRRISTFITDEASLKPKAHQVLYEEMKKTLQPIARTDSSQMLILQGASGLGKSHCTEHYFYYEANKHHQMVAWLSGKSKDAFLRDWEALANQLRSIDANRKDDSDTALIHHWCEEQLGQWLFIIDDMQIEIDWLKQYLPQKGGHVLITTTQPFYSLPQAAKMFYFSPLSSEDSELLLKAWLGKYWEAVGFAKEERALRYFSKALGGSPALLTQIALLVRKKGLSFERVMMQFQCPKTRTLLLSDTVLDELKGQTFLECVKKGWRQWMRALEKHYPQFTYVEHETHLKQFIEFLKLQVAHALEQKYQVYVDGKLILGYWQGVWSSLSCVPLDEEQVTSCLNLLPFSYDKTNQHWAVSVAGLHALEYQASDKANQVWAVSLPGLRPLEYHGDIESLYSYLPVIEAITSLVEEKDKEWVESYLNLLPFAYDKANQHPVASQLGLHALGYQSDKEGLYPFLSETETVSSLPKKKSDLPRLPSGIKLSFGLENNNLGSAEIALSTTSKLAEFTTWRLPTANPYFIPRPKLIHEIAEKLPRKVTHEQSAELVLAAVSGMGGIGKTELARHFITASESSSHYKKRFWFDAANISTLRNEFLDFAIYLGLIESKQYIEDKTLIQSLHRWFNLNPGWLMILDNADKYSSIAQWIPKEGGAVLITTREPKPGVLRDEQIVKISLLTAEEAIIWLYRLAQRDQNVVTEAEQQAARELVDNLGYLPLAIAQSAAYLREQKTISIKAYQQNFLELLLKDESLIEQDRVIDKQSDAYSRQVIASTWKLSLQMIEVNAKKKGLADICPTLLAVCSYLAPKDIPLGLLEYWFKEFYNLEGISLQSLSYLMDESIAQLVRYSLCEHTELTSMISMHKLVHEILCSGLAKKMATIYLDEQKGVVEKEFFPSLSEALIDYSAEFTPSIEDMKRRIDLIPHLQKIIATWETLGSQDEIKPKTLKALMQKLMATPKTLGFQGEINPKILVVLYNRLVEAQLELCADAKESLVPCQKQLDLCEKHFGPEHPSVASTLINLGDIYGKLGDAKQQKSLLERALHIGERHHGPEHPEVAKILINLSNAYGDLGSVKEQKRMLERALLILERHYDPGHPKVAISLVNLVKIYGDLGDSLQQKNLLEKALSIIENHYGSEHPYVATILVDLGIAYGDLGDARQQKFLLERAIHIRENYYGPEHFEVAKTFLNLSIAYGALGDIQQQKSLLERVLPIFENHYGPGHPDVARTLASLGNVYGDLGEAQQQKTLLERALLIFEQYYGSEHPDVAKTLANLGKAYGALKDAKQKKILLKKALRIEEQYYGPEHPTVASTLISLGNAYNALGDAQQQKDLLERALRIREQCYGPEHPEVAKALMSLGIAYGVTGRGDVQKQKSLLERALPILELHYGPKDPNVATVLANLGYGYGALGEFQQQKILLERALRIQEDHYGPEHPCVARTLADLGATYGALRDAKQQKLLLERALPIIERHYGPEHLDVAKALFNLGAACGVLGDAQQQKNLLERALPIFEQYYGLEHLHIATLLTNLGDVYGTLGDDKQQKLLLERALPIIERHYGPDHLDVAKALFNLGVVCSVLGDAQQQKDLLERALPIFENHYGPEHLKVKKTLLGLGHAYGVLGDAQQKHILFAKVLLFPAIVTGEFNTVQAIIEKQNFSIDWQEPHSQRTTLHLACISQQRDIVAYLLSKMAHFDIKDKEGKLAWEYVINTPLLALFKTTSAHFTQKYSAAVNAGIFLDWGKVLRMAVASDYLADVRFLIEVKGIDINSVDANSKTLYTALHLAVIKNRPEVAKYLISNGADINALDANKKTPSDYIKPEQEELLLFFNLSVNDTPEDYVLNFNRLCLQM